MVVPLPWFDPKPWPAQKKNFPSTSAQTNVAKETGLLLWHPFFSITINLLLKDIILIFFFPFFQIFLFVHKIFSSMDEWGSIQYRMLHSMLLLGPYYKGIIYMARKVGRGFTFPFLCIIYCPYPHIFVYYILYYYISSVFPLLLLYRVRISLILSFNILFAHKKKYCPHQ